MSVQYWRLVCVSQFSVLAGCLYLRELQAVGNPATSQTNYIEAILKALPRVEKLDSHSQEQALAFSPTLCRRKSSQGSTRQESTGITTRPNYHNVKNSALKEEQLQARQALSSTVQSHISTQTIKADEKLINETATQTLNGENAKRVMLFLICNIVS